MTELFSDLARRYPDVWKTLDVIRAQRGVGDFPDWPDICFLPVGVASEYARAVATASNTPPLPGDGVRMAVLGGWRPSQDIYRFESELYAALIGTDMGKIPTEVLLRLPAWAVYVETPGADWMGTNMLGFWAALDDHAGKPELLLVPHSSGDSDFTPLALALDTPDLQDAITAGLEGMLSPGKILDKATMRSHQNWGRLVSAMGKMVSLVLYICSTEPDINHDSGLHPWPPSLPVPKKIKTGWRLFAADKPTIWRVGETIARQIRAASDAERGTHTGPRPHIRRAHWHGFWSGTVKPREGVEPTPRNFNLKWLPPIAVALKEDE